MIGSFGLGQSLLIPIRDEERRFTFAEVLPDQVRVLAETAERAHEIDVDRAKRAKERAEQRISRGGDDLDFAVELITLERAVVRIHVSERSRD